MNYNKGQLGQIAKQYGFVRDTFEKSAEAERNIDLFEYR